MDDDSSELAQEPPRSEIPCLPSIRVEDSIGTKGSGTRFVTATVTRHLYNFVTFGRKIKYRGHIG